MNQQISTNTVIGRQKDHQQLPYITVLRKMWFILPIFSVSNETCLDYRQGLERSRYKTPAIDSVLVKNESRPPDKLIVARSFDQIEGIIADFYGFDTSGSVSYDVLNHMC
jgi:hypothetical protein